MVGCPMTNAEASAEAGWRPVTSNCSALASIFGSRNRSSMPAVRDDYGSRPWYRLIASKLGHGERIGLAIGQTVA